MTRLEDKKRDGLLFVIPIILIVLLSTIVFLPCVRNNFVNWDDPDLIVNNPAVHNLSLHNIKTIFSSFYCGTYIPLTLFSFMLEYRLVGLKPWLYHTTNLILHLITVLLVFWVSVQLSRSYWLSVIVALLFAIHPARADSIAWVTERKDVLFAMFYFASLVSYLYYSEKNNAWIFYSLSLIFFCLSLLSKTTAATLPVILLLCDYLKKRRGIRTLTEKLPFFLLAIPFIVIAIIAQKTLPGHSFPFFKNIFIANYVLLFYLFIIIAPFNLSSLYPYPSNIITSLPAFFWMTPFIIMLLIIAVFYSIRYTRIILFGALFFLASLAPVLQFLPVAGPEIAANRYTYIPAFGLFFILASGITYLYSGPLKFMKTRIGKILIALILLIFLTKVTMITHERCKLWHDSITLWTNVLAHYPELPHAYTMRGDACLENRDYKGAINDYSKAIDINPFFPAACLGRARAYALQNDLQAALVDYVQTINNHPNNPMAFFGRANIRLRQGLYEQAVIDYSQALNINPLFTAAYVNRGNAYSALTDYNKALADYDQAIIIDPDYADAYYNRAVVYFLIGSYEKTLKDIEMCRRLGYRIKPEFLEAVEKNVKK